MPFCTHGRCVGWSICQSLRSLVHSNRQFLTQDCLFASSETIHKLRRLVTNLMPAMHCGTFEGTQSPSNTIENCCSICSSNNYLRRKQTLLWWESGIVVSRDALITGVILHRCRFTEMSPKWRLSHGNEARMLFNQNGRQQESVCVWFLLPFCYSFYSHAVFIKLQRKQVESISVV